MLKTYSEAIQYLYANLPVFQRIGSSAYKPDLTNTLTLCASLGNPQNSFTSVHIAGTNGKGSTSHMLASIMQTAGYKTGLYTSPHLKEFTERIRVNGHEIEKDFVLTFVTKIKPVIEEVKPSFFEITVAMAFDYFAYKKIDVAIIETGLGGRLDATNVIHPIVSLITNIGLDHTDLLGDTLEKIAFEKAGIIKPDTPVVISERQPEVEKVFINKATQEHSSLYFAEDDYRIAEKINRDKVGLTIWRHGSLLFENLRLPLQGFYQRKNVSGVLKAVDVLNMKGFTISNENIKEGLLQVVHTTHLKGRWQKLNDKPLIICDTGHNADGMREIMNQIKAQKFKTLYMVLGMVKDKDIRTVLALLPKTAIYFFCQANIPRAMEAQHLAEQAKEFSLTGSVVKNVNDAIQQAKQMATDDDFIFVGGSTFVVAEIENL